MATKKRRPDITTAQPVRKKAKISKLTKAQIRREDIKTGGQALKLSGAGISKRVTSSLNKLSKLSGKAKAQAKKKLLDTIDKRKVKLLKGETKESLDRARRTAPLRKLAKAQARIKKILQRTQSRRKKK